MGLLGYELIGARVDKLSLLFGYLFHIAAFLGLVFSLRCNDRLQQGSSLLYAGSAVGAVFAGDLITLFVYWEILATSSVFLIWARRTARANAAGVRYMIFQVGSGAEAEVARVVAVEDGGITIDANHPLAGVSFHFEISVLESREASGEELEVRNMG